MLVGGLEGRKPTLHGRLAEAMVELHTDGVHAERAMRLRRPVFPQVGSERSQKLRPDRDHSDKQRNRRQSRCLLHENPQHYDLLIRNIEGTLFLFCSEFKSLGKVDLELFLQWLTRALGAK
jgi:hypothetical protein